MSDANHLLENLLGTLLSDQTAALAYSQAPADYLYTELGDADLDQVSLGDVISNASNTLEIAPETTTTLLAAAPSVATPAAPAAGAPAAAAPAAPAAAPAAPVTITEVEQNFNSVVSEYYGGDTEITENIVDNSTDFEIELEDIGGGKGGKGNFKDDGEVEIDIDNTVTNANALGEDSVAAGGALQGVATGDGANAIGGDAHDAQQNSGDDALLIDGSNDGVAIAGGNSGIAANGDVTDAIIGSGNTQVDEADVVVSGNNNAVTNVDGSDNNVGSNITEVDADNAVVGNNNATIQDGSDVTAGFGSGNVTNLEGASFDNSNVNFGDGGAVQDNDTTTTSTTTDSFNETVDIDTTLTTEITVDNDESLHDVGNIDDNSHSEISESFNDIEQEIEVDDHSEVSDVEALDG